MAILPRAGRTAIAKAVKEKPMFVAWGTGDPAWDALLPEIVSESSEATALIDEVGRRITTAVEFVTPDENGFIEIDGAGKLSVSAEPTHMLLVTARFDFGDAPTAVIREVGVFIGGTTDPALPPGQVYFTPDQVVDPGDLLQLEHKRPMYRGAGTREIIEILIVF